MLKTRIRSLMKSVAQRTPGMGQLYRDYRSQQIEIQAHIHSLENCQAEILNLQDVNRTISKAHQIQQQYLKDRVAELETNKNLIERRLKEALDESESLRARVFDQATDLAQFSEEIRRLNLLARDLSYQLQDKLIVMSESTESELKKLNAYFQGLLSLEESSSHLRLSARKRSSSAGDASDDAGTRRWLNLLESVLTGTAMQDPSSSPWSDNKFDPAVRTIGRDWPSQALTMIGTARMRNLRALTERVIADGIPGDLLEAGVWRGGACIYMKAIVEAYSDTRRRVFVADSFKGLPKPDVKRFPQDQGDQHHEVEELRVQKKEVEESFSRFGLLDEDVVFLEGWFKDTLPAAPIDRLALLRLDGDMYESTIQTLEAVYRKVSPGGYVIVDDYVLEPCAQAVNDYRGANSITAEIRRVDGAAVWWQVEG